MLKSFVSDADYPRLIDLLKKVQAGTLQKEVSIVEIWGDGSNGKSTFINFLSMFNTWWRINLEDAYARGFDVSKGPNNELSAFEQSMVIASEVQPHPNVIKMLSSFHMEINKRGGISCRKLYSMDEIHIDNPGVIIFATNTFYEIATNGENRRPLYFHFPNTFKHDLNVNVVEQCLEEFNEITRQ